MGDDASKAIASLGEENGATTETVHKKIRLKTSTAEKMLRVYPLFAEDPANLPKEGEALSFMVEKAVDWLFSSGEIEKRVLEIAKKG